MSRVFRDMEECVKEMDRELMQSGITCPIKHYQNKKLYGEDQITKELVGVSFTISKPLEKRKEALFYLFGEEAERIEQYCQQEFEDRINPEILNPGNSYKIRQDMWQKFMVKEETKFDYTYNERFNRFQSLDFIYNCLVEDKHTRQAILSVWHPDFDEARFGGDTRIPCSLNYQFMIRNDRLYVIYHMRSNDLLGHAAIDLWISAEMIKYMRDRLVKDGIYPDLKTGSLVYFAGSLHAYSWDLKTRVIF